MPLQGDGCQAPVRPITLCSLVPLVSRPEGTVSLELVLGVQGSDSGNFMFYLAWAGTG